MLKKYSSIVILLFLLVCFANAQHKIGELVWSDEFNYTGLPDSSKWSYNIGGSGWGNDEIEYYTSNKKENARVENGKLIIEARKEECNGMHYSSARLVTKGKGDWLYGRIDVRAKLPKGKGTWPAIWMLSSDWSYGHWPESGEIDIMEHVGYDPDAIHFSTHCKDYYFRINTQKTAIMKADRSDSLFYTYSVDWTPDKIDGYINDSLYFSTTNERLGWKKWPFDKPFHLILNLAVGGFWGGAAGIDESIWPQKMEVDYVRVYKYNAEKDIQKPSVPTIMDTAKISSSSIDLKWDISYDNFGVKEYLVYCNDKEVGRTVYSKFNIEGLEPMTNYKIKIISKDWAGNASESLVKEFKTTR